MAKYIGTYPNTTAIETAVDGGELSTPYVALAEDTKTVHYGAYEPTNDYFKLRNVSNNVGTFTIKLVKHPNQPNLKYSFDGENWENVTFANNLFSVSVNPKKYVCFKGNNVYGLNGNNYNAITFMKMDVPHNVEGKLTTLLSEDNYGQITTIPRYGFKSLFGYYDDHNTNLISAAKLSFDNITTIEGDSNGGGCKGMFSGCSALTTPPDLSGITTLSTTTASQSMVSMFASCTSLTTPAKIYNITTIVTNYNSYSCGVANMYIGCTNLSCVYTTNTTSFSGGLYGGNYDNWLYNAGTSATGQKTIYVPNQTVYDAIPKTNTNIVPSGWNVAIME